MHNGNISCAKSFALCLKEFSTFEKILIDSVAVGMQQRVLTCAKYFMPKSHTHKFNQKNAHFRWIMGHFWGVILTFHETSMWKNYSFVWNIFTFNTKITFALS